MEEPRAGLPDFAAALARQRAGRSYGEAGRLLKAHLETSRAALGAQDVGGDVAARRLSALMDGAIRSILEAAPEGRTNDAFAVLAVGGYGRGQLAPYSDIDLLFLREEGASLRVIEALLYPLYDAGLKLGQSTHTPASAAEFARADMTGRTAFLDARLIAGSKALERNFNARFEKLRKRTKRQFEAAKSAEREARHDRSEQSRFLAEPDLKEGKGGLRDLHAMRWLYKYEFAGEIDAQSPKRAILSASDIAAFRRAERFLWSLRFQLHLLKGRAEEKLSFDLQPLLAERLGYADRSGVSAAERLMRHYFVNAMDVGRLTRIFSAKLEEERSRLSPKALKVAPKTLMSDEAEGRPNLRLQGGRLHFEDAAGARKRAIDHFRLFRAFSKRPDLDFHPDALAIVSTSLAAIDAGARDDPTIAKLFLYAVVEAKDRLKLLRVMAETGLLGKYIPSFGRIIGRIEYGLYRRFSIDENVFQSIGVLAEIASGAARDKHPIATRIVEAQHALAPYYVAILLHETRWSMRGGTEEDAERLIARIAHKLGLTEGEAQLAAWCAARPLLMATTAERRNLSEPATIARFAARVGARARLDLLLVIAICHLRVVGAYSWDDQTRRQLTELHHGAVAWLEGGDARLIARLEERANEARAAAAQHLASWPGTERDAFLSRLSDAVFRAVEPDLVARIAELARGAEGRARAAVAVRLRDGLVEAIVYADDRKGLLADLAGATSSAGFSVRSVQAMTSEDGKAIDIFAIQAHDGAPVGDAEAVRGLHARLLAAAEQPPRKRPSLSPRIGDRRAIFAVPPAVRVDADASEECLVVEAEGRDRLGLLYDLCSAIAGLGLTIASAHIATYGARAIDSFYLKEPNGAKPADPARIGAIEAALLGVFADGGAGANPLAVER